MYYDVSDETACADFEPHRARLSTAWARSQPSLSSLMTLGMEPKTSGVLVGPTPGPSCVLGEFRATRTVFLTEMNRHFFHP